MIDIGQRIKELREARHLTGKDLAGRIGLSPSQMTRIEKGQRRVDSDVIARLARALDLSPSDFFAPSEAEPAPPPSRGLRDAPDLHSEIGRLIRSERRQRHMTVEALADRTGRSRAYVIAVEQGRRSGSDGDFLRKACRVLQIDPFLVLERQEVTLRALGVQVERLGSAVAAAQGEDGIPILLGDEQRYPADFTAEGEPAALVEGILRIPELLSRKAFALRVRGLDMTGDLFHDGDLVLFDGLREARSGEFAFIRLRTGRSLFGQLFRDPGGTVRIQYLRPEVAPEIMSPNELIRAWPLAAHVVIGDPRRRSV